jgi:uncharacterized protein YkwD
VRRRDLVTVVITAGILAVTLLLPRMEALLVRDADTCPQSGDVPTRSNLRSTRTAVLCLLNRERAEHGLAALRRSSRLELASQRHSEDMAARNFFAHETPDGIDPGARMAAAGYPATASATGENIAWGSAANATPVRIVQGWMKSPGHRANILRPEFTEVGVGVAHEAPRPYVDGRVGVYTTDFGGRSNPTSSQLPTRAYTSSSSASGSSSSKFSDR